MPSLQEGLWLHLELKRDSQVQAFFHQPKFPKFRMQQQQWRSRDAKKIDLFINQRLRKSRKKKKIASLGWSFIPRWEILKTLIQKLNGESKILRKLTKNFQMLQSTPTMSTRLALTDTCLATLGAHVSDNAT